MCSFLITNKPSDLTINNTLLKNRGPDSTNTIKNNNISFLHNLLHITGEKTTQPLVRDDVYLLFNGEIYNYNKGYKNDTHFLLDLYLNEGEQIYKKIDGEYSVVIVDFRKDKIIFSGDIFLTKPIYYSLEDKNFGICSYASNLKKLGFNEIKRPKPNHYYVLSLKTLKLEEITPIYNFNLKQNIDTFELWNLSFENSLIKRAKTENKIIIPLSSGHDSGAILCGMNKLKFKNFSTYSFECNENKDILKKRLTKINNKKVLSKITSKEYQLLQKLIKDNVEPFYYGYSYETSKEDGMSDDAAVGLYKLLSDAKKQNKVKILMSGQGGDEIFSNDQQYGFDNKFNPTIFPKNLKTIFPWPNFYFGGNYSYLTKEEHIAGSLGIEARYPYLDKDVVQQFLNLTPEFKNKYYKSPLTNYMQQNNFPYFLGKLGFKLDTHHSEYLNKISRIAKLKKDLK